MEIEHSLDIRQNLSGTRIFLPLRIIPLFGVFSVLLWRVSDVAWCRRSKSGCRPSRLLHTHPGDRRIHCSWSVGRRLEHWTVWTALLTIWRYHSGFGRRFSICLLWQCRLNGTRVGGRSWCKYGPCEGNLRGRRWEEVNIDLFLWFYWVHRNQHRAGGNHLFSLRTRLVLHEMKTSSGWIHWWGFRQWTLSMLPIRIWIMSRWFLLEDRSLFLGQFEGRKDSGGQVFLLWTC